MGNVLGIVGGIGPESTIDYYRLLLTRFRERPGIAAPGMLINSIDLSRLLALANAGSLVELTDYLLEAVGVLARAGATLGLFASNTPHLVFDDVQRRSPIPLVSIVSATCDAAHALGLRRLGLLGTRVTMQGRFYSDVMHASGIDVVAPNPGEQDYVQDKYLNELVAGKVSITTRTGFLAVIERMREYDKIDGVILGGTELPLLLRDVTHRLPFLDTTRIHVDAVVARVVADAGR